MMTIEEVRTKLLQRNLKQVARETGIKYMSVRNFAKGVTMNPMADTYLKLVDYLTNY